MKAIFREVTIDKEKSPFYSSFADTVPDPVCLLTDKRADSGDG